MGNTGNTTVFNNFYDTSDIAVINAGYQKKVDHSFGPYTNNYHVLQYILDGQGTLRIGSNEWHLTKNTLFYLPANTACKYYADLEDPYEYYWVSFIGNKADSIMQNCGFSHRTPLRVIDSPELRKLFMRIFKSLHSNQSDYTYRILSDLYGIFACAAESSDMPLAENYSAFVQSAIAYMNANYENGINVRDVSSHMYMNFTYFSEQFTRGTGINPSKYLMGIRMTNGALLLKTIDLKVSEIALQVGMTHIAYTNAFKKHYRYTPKEYRGRSEKTVDNN